MVLAAARLTMEFTRKTYRHAYGRSLKIETECWHDHLRACRGPEAWLRRWHHTNLIRARAIVEGKTWFRLRDLFKVSM